MSDKFQATEKMTVNNRSAMIFYGTIAFLFFAFVLSQCLGVVWSISLAVSLIVTYCLLCVTYIRVDFEEENLVLNFPLRILFKEHRYKYSDIKKIKFHKHRHCATSYLSFHCCTWLWYFRTEYFIDEKTQNITDFLDKKGVETVGFY